MKVDLRICHRLNDGALVGMARIHPAFNQIDHRPWPLPQKRYLLRQQWLDLLFLHWRVNFEQIRAMVPEPLEIDCFEGEAWIAVVPFDMKGIGFRGLPSVPALSDFPEINVRTYVTYQGKPGVWFFSLDVPNRFAAWAARTFFHLPYRYAVVSIEAVEDGAFRYRQSMGSPGFDATYQSGGRAEFIAGSFEDWATERYCLYCQRNSGEIYRTEVNHPKWPLQQASIAIHENRMLNEFDVGERHPSVLYSKKLDVVAYLPERIV